MMSRRTQQSTNVVLYGAAVFALFGCSPTQPKASQASSPVAVVEMPLSKASEPVPITEPAFLVPSRTEARQTAESTPVVEAESTPAPSPVPEPASAPAPAPAVAPAAPRATPPVNTHPAALALLNEATRQEKSGELELAAAKLERALKIEPRSAFLWHRLATVRLLQGQGQLAANLAAKSNSYAANDADLVELNQKIIDRSKRRN